MLIAGIPLTNLNLFMGALGVGIGFGLQSFIANIISGIIIAFEKPLYVGDVIEMEGGTKGKVTDIGLRATTIDTADGAEYVIPNNEVIGKVLKNWTLTSKHYKLEIDLLMDHDNDPNLILATAREVLLRTAGVFSHPGPSVRLAEIQSNGLQFKLSCWISSLAEANRMKNDLLTALHLELMKAGVKYPKPPRS
jgi:small-conductance mechanosensitive channel